MGELHPVELRKDWERWPLAWIAFFWSDGKLQCRKTPREINSPDVDSSTTKFAASNVALLVSQKIINRKNGCIRSGSKANGQICRDRTDGQKTQTGGWTETEADTTA